MEQSITRIASDKLSGTLVQFWHCNLGLVGLNDVRKGPSIRLDAILEARPMVALTGEAVGCREQLRLRAGKKIRAPFPRARTNPKLSSHQLRAMSRAMSAVNNGWKCSRCLYNSQFHFLVLRIRSFSSTTHGREELQTQASTAPHPPSPLASWKTPDTVVGKQQEKLLLKKTGKMPVGSRRRRLLLRTFAQTGESGIPFTQLPYQCFQEARKYLAEDRKEKIAAIELLRKRIINLMAQDPVSSGGEQIKQCRLDGMKKTLEHYKILADVNDPIVKKNFEDGKGIVLDLVCVVAFTNH